MESLPAMSSYLVPLISACATWLDRAYGGETSPLLAAMVQVQARQAVTIAAWLRYPTTMDAALVNLIGTGGAGRLDAQVHQLSGSPEPWRTWVDEAVVSWAACLLVDRILGRTAVDAATGTEHAQGLSLCFRSLLEPDAREARASALLRHPDLMEPVAGLHRAELCDLLGHPYR
jgi:hypothetical protein